MDNENKVGHIVDGDTLITDKKIRVTGINTPESVHKDESRNTPKGEEASEFAKAVLPKGSEVETTPRTVDHFDRQVADVKRVINGVEIDYGLVALDQDFSNYYLKKGKHPDPVVHGMYKNYYSKDLPYEFGATFTPLDDDKVAEMEQKHALFSETYIKFQDGDATQEELDEATVNLYGNSDDVVRYRQHLSEWNKPKVEQDPNGLTAAMQKAFELQPELREVYNRNVRNSELTLSQVPEQEPDFIKKLTTSIDMFSIYSNGVEADKLWDTRRLGEDFEVPKEELTKGVPEQYHSMLYQEANRYNDQSALLLRDQLIEDIGNNKIFDNLEWYAQFGYGLLGTISDPTSIVGGSVIAKGGYNAVNTVRAYTTNKAVRNTALATTWATGGAAESSLINAPRLASDHTYTARDLQLDMIFDAGLGLGLGAAFTGASKYWDYNKNRMKAKEKEVNEIQDKMENNDEPVEPTSSEMQEANEKAERSNVAKSNEKIKKLTKSETQFTPWEAITEVSPSGFRTAVKTLDKTFPQDSPMRKLLNNQLGLLNKKLSPEETVEANKLSADLLHIVSAFPDGNIPKNIEQAIDEVTWNQKVVGTRHVIQNLIRGKVANPADELKSYVRALENQEHLWKGYDVQPVATADFYKQHGEWLNREKSTSDELGNLSKELPKELSFLKDLVELNQQAVKSGDSAFVDLVERLNGMVTTRLEQKEFGEAPRYRDSNQSFGKTVQMSAKEIFEQLKKEGLQPRTTEYSKRKEELKKRGKVAVSKDVQEVGRADDFVKSTKVEESDRPDSTEGEYYLREDQKTEMEAELDELLLKESKGTELTPKELKRVESIQEELDNWDKEQLTTTQLIGDNLDQDILPRSITTSVDTAAYKNPTTENLKNLREAIDRKLTKKLGLKQITGKKEWKQTQERLEKVKQVMVTKKGKVIDRMVKAGKWENVQDVIRVSHTLAEEAKLKPKPEKPKDDKTPKVTEKEPDTTALTEEDLEVLADDNTGVNAPKVSEEDFANIKDKANKAYERMLDESANSIKKHLSKFIESGERKLFKDLRTPRGVLDYVGKIASKLTEDIGTKLLNSKITSLEYFGARVTEIGKGFGGTGRRKATGGLMKEEAWRNSIMKIIPQYVQAIDNYAMSKGKGHWARMNAQQQATGDNPLVGEFSREVFKVQEYRRQGKPLPKDMDKSVLEFVDQWNKYMEHNHNELVTNNVGGFTKERKIANYIPHVWKKENLLLAESKVGKDKIIQLLTKGYESAIRNGTNSAPLESASELASRQFDWIMGQDAKATDQWLPVKDSRAQQRLEIDTLAEIDGLNILDLIESDIATVATKYSQRMSGWVGLSKSTDGMLTSEMDIKVLRSTIEQEAKDLGIDPKKHLKHYDDVIDLMFGRPTRGGLPEELRMLKDLTALTRMGGLGTAQLIESGQVITRSVLNTFSEPSVAKKHIQAGLNKGEDENTLLREIQGLTNLTDDMEWLDRQSVHLDQAELNELSKMRQLSLWMADKGTWGKLKAPASRLLGKTSGFNMIRRAQSRVTQMSFTMDIAKHFHNGSGKMGNKRMADLGLTDVNGRDTDLEEAFSKHVEFKDGLPVKLNFDKWDKSALEKFKYAAMRDEAQQIQKTIVGELPPWMNKPIMSLIFQFRQMPLVATNKQLARSLAFADKEAVTAIMLNTAIAGLVRYSKFALLGLGVKAITDHGVQDPTLETMQMDKYITQLGIFADAYDLGLQATQIESAGDAKDTVLRQVPVLGLMNDYKELTTNEAFSRKQIDAAHGLVPLGNTAYGDMIHAKIQELNSGE